MHISVNYCSCKHLFLNIDVIVLLMHIEHLRSDNQKIVVNK